MGITMKLTSLQPSQVRPDHSVALCDGFGVERQGIGLGMRFFPLLGSPPAV
jgi:hypothetical protein